MLGLRGAGDDAGDPHRRHRPVGGRRARRGGDRRRPCSPGRARRWPWRAGSPPGRCWGRVNGLLITKARIQPFIVTLAMMIAARGVALGVTGENSVRVDRAAEGFLWLGRGRVLGVPVPVVLAALAFVAGWIVLRYTRFGRYVYAAGDHQDAARLLGLKVDRVLIATYALSGALAALAGIVLAGRLGAGQPVAGTGWELDAIAAVVVGGTLLSGGQGGVGSTAVGRAAAGGDLQPVQPGRHHHPLVAGGAARRLPARRGGGAEPPAAEGAACTLTPTGRPRRPPARLPRRRTAASNPLSGEWVLVSPHRALRPWQGAGGAPRRGAPPRVRPHLLPVPRQRARGRRAQPRVHRHLRLRQRLRRAEAGRGPTRRWTWTGSWWPAASRGSAG